MFLTAKNNKKRCYKAVDNYLPALEIVLDCFKTQNLCIKSIDTYSSQMQLVSECYKTHKMCDKAVDAIMFKINIRLKK